MIQINPNPIAFHLPFIEHPVTWYGICFALGLLMSLTQVKRWLRSWRQPASWEPIDQGLDQLLGWSIVGVLLGARTFEILFYSPHLKLGEFLYLWKGGLSSHGGITGLLLANLLYWQIYRNSGWIQQLKMSLGQWLDTIAAAGGLAAAMIRFGNFINQEIVGLPSDMPWAVTFGNPAGHLAVVPRHPVQLYEALCYLLLWLAARWRLRKGPIDGRVCAEVLIAIFLLRCLLESYKAPVSLQDELLADWRMGQLLSLPPLLLAILWRGFYAWKAQSRKSR